MRIPDSFYVEKMSMTDFILGMISLGKPIELSLVGAFDNDAHGRGSRRDIELPPHRDGVYSSKLAAVQAGHYVEKPGIEYVGLYCVRNGEVACYTTINNNEETEVAAVNLQEGEALIFDNKKVMHGRRGAVGNRILIRMWVGATAA